MLLTHVLRPRIRARTQDIVTRFSEGQVRGLVGDLFGNHGRVLQRTYLETMVRVLAEQGHVGLTIRSGPPKLATPIDPITVTFEPRLLDEADASTVELLDSLESTTRSVTTTTSAAADTPERLADRLAVRRAKRNIRMAGGWLLFVVFAIQYTRQARQRRCRLGIKHAWRVGREAGRNVSRSVARLRGVRRFPVWTPREASLGCLDG